MVILLCGGKNAAANTAVQDRRPDPSRRTAGFNSKLVLSLEVIVIRQFRAISCFQQLREMFGKRLNLVPISQIVATAFRQVDARIFDHLFCRHTRAFRLSRTAHWRRGGEVKNAAKSVIDIHFLLWIPRCSRTLSTYLSVASAGGLQAFDCGSTAHENAYHQPFRFERFELVRVLFEKSRCIPNPSKHLDPRADEDAIERRQRGPLLLLRLSKVEELCF